ncbi:MAG TPA: hypothetical protein VN698_04415 [Bacteroidia bacterium]|nr:hypothetical protein [Bacteroidia bacterium]
MTTYILIMIVIFNGNQSAISQEFNTQKACINASNELIQAFKNKNLYATKIAVCVPKD